MKSIYLDYNATTPIAPSVQEAMLPFMAEFYACPNANYAPARAVAESLEDARGQVAHLLGATSDEILFCASGTESCNLGILGAVQRHLLKNEPCHLITSAIEHPAVSQTVNHCHKMGCDVSILPTLKNGEFDLDALEDLIRPETRLVSVMLANDETGVIQPVQQLAMLCKNREILIHCDAIQAAGKISVQPHQLGVDLLSISAHKFYGPKGAAALYIRSGTQLDPIIHGHGNEFALRAGMENVMSCIGMGKAAHLVGRSIDASAEKLLGLTRRLQKNLATSIQEPITVHGKTANRLPNTVLVNLPRVSGFEILARIPEIHAATWTSSLTGKGNCSTVLEAMGVSEAEKLGTIRFSTGWYNSEEEIDRASELVIHAWESICK